MRLQVLLTSIIQVAVVESLREVTAYLGDNVTLLSGADRSWNLSKIEWSIFSNNTWIATYRDGKLNINRFYRYKGRLHLNISSGDLVIRNVNREDDMEYSVDLFTTEGRDSVDKIKLTVKERMMKPTIQHISNKAEEGGCWIVLHCFSPDNGTNFTWRVEHPNVTVISERDQAVLLAFLNSTENSVKFTCTASKDMDKASSSIDQKCKDKNPQPESRCPECRCRHATTFFLGFFLGALLAAFLTYFFREQIKAALEFIKAKLFPPKSS